MMKSKPFTIAEIGQAHEGSLGIAHSFIDALASTGVDAIKFQMHIADAESSSHEEFRLKFSYEDNTRFDYWKRMEFTLDQWKGLKNHCEEKGVEFLASPFSIRAIEVLEDLGVNKYKIGSGESSNFLLLDRISKTKKDVIISIGLINQDELEETISFLKKRNCTPALLQCTTAYPTKPEQWNLHRISLLKDKFNLPVGFSDHSGNIYACLAANTLGADILEFHVTFDKRMFGPDAKASLTIDQVSSLMKGVNEISFSLNNPEENNEIKRLKGLFGKSLSLNKDLQAGNTIMINDLETTKPAGLGISPKEYESVIGRKLIVNKRKGDFINLKDLR